MCAHTCLSLYELKYEQIIYIVFSSNTILVHSNIMARTLCIHIHVYLYMCMYVHVHPSLGKYRLPFVEICYLLDFGALTYVLSFGLIFITTLEGNYLPIYLERCEVRNLVKHFTDFFYFSL